MTVKKRIDAAGGVLVAHDGSKHAAEALRIALRHAEALGLPVTVVRAWNITTAPRPETTEFGYVPPIDDFEAATQAALDRELDTVRTEYPDVAITSTVVHGHPASTLIEASERVDLLVVGSRGRGGFMGLLLGSVSEQIVRHARCPVLVARSRGEVETIEQTVEDNDTEILGTLEKALVSELKLD